MAMNATTIFPRILKALRENSNVKEKREALTYISSQAKKLESSGAIKEERYKELCKLVIEAFTKDEGSLQYEALGALNIIVNEFQAHSLHLFESILQTDKRTRLKILKLLEVAEDNAITAAITNDGQALNFFKNCMDSVQPSLMEWITSTACTDNLQMLTRVEHQVLSDEQKLEEDTISYSLALLRRLYKLAAITRDLNIERFDALLMDKIVTLAYMGHKRQRGFALKVLQQTVGNNTSLRICKDHPDIWAQYKNNLQSMYCKRMLLLVAACEPDWTTQWNITIQFLGTDLHRGAGLINNLLSVEEKAFKSTDAIIRRQAFLSWKLLIDNFALDHQELATARRIKLLCIPLNAKNSKTELIALTKLEVWWHLIIKLYKDIEKFVTPVIVQFLNFCFGPLGDTPLLSTKFDVVASPGKRFLKTKVVALDALYQLVVPKEENSTICAPMLEERLPHAISFAVFQECSKSIIHSTGEALLILAQLTDQEMKNRFQFGRILWASLITYIRNLKLEQKDHLYRDVIVIITELGNYIDKPMMQEMIFNVILPDLNQIIKNTEFVDNALPELVLKLLSLPMLGNGPRDFSYYTIKCLLQRCVSPEITYSSGVLGFLETIVENLGLVGNMYHITVIYAELWCIIAEILTKYIAHYKKIDEGNENEDKFKAVKTVLSFPFQYTSREIFQIQEQTIIWKALYKQFELQADSIGTVKPNEILLDVASMMQKSLKANKNCSYLIVNCLDALLSTINYEFLLAQDEIPSITQLIIDVTITSFNNSQNPNYEVALKTLSAMLITIYGHKPHKIVSYLHNCKPVIELMFKSQLKTISKEIASTWETIISIFKGLNKQLNHELLSSYKEILVMAINHSNSDIKSLTQSILKIKDGLDNTAKCILDEVEKTIEKPTSHPKADSVTKKKEEAGKSKEIRVAGSFLNKKSADTKSVANKPLEKNDKKTFILPESDSQEYIYIKTDLKFDVNRLTEHQKETLKKKRDDIPALYNDLSQSSSQNSQNLQEWFNIKAKHINESDKINSKKSDSITHKPTSNDANKENKVTVVHTELNMIDKIINNSKTDENIGENVLDIKHNKDLTKGIGKEDSSSQNEGMDTSKQANSTSHSRSTIGQDSGQTPEVNEEMDVENSISSVAKKLNFESRDEFPEDNMHEGQSSPSMLDSTKRRYRSSMTKLSSSLRSDEVTESKKNQSTTNIQRTLRMKAIQGKPGISGKGKTQDDTDIKENPNENKKAMKRKYMSDTESDGVVQRQKRKLMSFKDSNNDDNKSRDNDNSSDTADTDILSQRMKTEISRLKIDMVFDCPAVNRRRTKYSDDETTSKKTSTSDNKSLKSKSVDVKSGDGARKSLKTIEKSVKDANDTNQGLLKRRSRRSTKQEPDKNDLDVTKESRRSSDTTDKLPQSKNSGNTDTTYVVSMPSGAVQNAITDRVQDEKLDKDDMSSSNKNTEFVDNIESDEQSQDEIEDVVESSQSSNTNTELNKRCSEKQCFIKIDKIINIQAVRTPDVIVEKNYVPESASMDCGDNDVSDPCEQSDEAIPNNNTEISDEGNKDSVNKNSIQDNDSSNNTKAIIPQNQKVIDSPALKPAGVTNFSSPKSSSKAFKLKPFTVHGRAAHMLGLVTRQSQIDNDGATIEDDSLIKKLKSKDIEIEMSVNKKTSTIKEVDKIGGPSGSRQEKIFSNMRSADYCISAFNTLRNDGEKLSSKLDKSTSDLSMENSTDKENEGNKSPSCEKDDLPILEWSSANPPSLNASPSASILKRHRSSLSEVDSDFTILSKRKRVSFADPPVSKEMGYEIAIMDSPSKGNKCSTARVITPKKDSPLRVKQTKLKLATTELEKSTNEVDAQNEGNKSQNNATTLLAEKADESLTKISEACSDAIDVDTPSNSSENNNVTEANSYMNIKIDDLALQVEITVDSASSAPENQQLLSSEAPQNSSSVESIGMQESETQQDIFDGMDAKNNITSIQTSTDNVDTSIQNNSVDSIKLNVTNDSVMEALPTKEENLEDTMDVQNVTELNSTINPDEVFCGKLLRTSTRTTENVAEQDTLPVTDSVFASLPLTENDRNEGQNAIEIVPELLDSTQPIYPTLSSCREPLDAIVGQLTNPLWKQNLSSYFANRSLRTIGDLAQLSEREVHRIPVKGKPKIEFVRKVLQHFENTSSAARQKRSLPTCIYAPQADPSDQVVQSPTMTTDEAPSISVAPISDPMKAASATTNNESVSYNCSTPLPQSNGKALDNLSIEKSPIESLDKTGSMNSDINVSSESGNPDLSALNTNRIDGQTNVNVSVTVHNPIETSMDDKLLPIANSSISANTKTVNEGSSDGSMLASEISLNVCDEPLITHSSIGTSTDDLCSPVSSVNKATKSVGSQMALEELLDEIDINLVLESAIRRCSPEAILSQYKQKMGHLTEAELAKETIRILGFHNQRQLNDSLLKAVCRAYGLNKVLLRLPDIFNSDKQFFDKVFKVYNKKLKIIDCLNAFDCAQLKSAVCQKYMTSELAEMLSDKLKQDEQEGIKQPMPELSSLNAMLQRLPMDVIISHTVANEEVIPASVVLDIALQNNSSGDIARALQAQSPARARNVLDKLRTSQFTVAHIENEDVSKENLLNIFKSVCSKLTAQELLNAYHEVMTSKLIMKQDKQ